MVKVRFYGQTSYYNIVRILNEEKLLWAMEED